MMEAEMPTCIEWAEERTQECTETADEGFNECANFRAQCCTWWPCSWGCEAVSWVCTCYKWVEVIVCVGWTWVSTAVCVAWDVVTMMASAMLVAVEFIVGGVLSVLATAVELLQSIPVFGALIRWLINVVTWMFWTIHSIPDAVLGLFGIRPEKKLRLCTIIMQDMNDNRMAVTRDVVALLQLACDVYKRDCNVRVIPHWPLRISTGFAGAETSTEDWITLDPFHTGEDVLTVGCEGDGVAADWWTIGSVFQLRTIRNCFTGAARRVIGYGAPIAVFIIRDGGGLGCSLLMTDYVTVDGMASDPTDAQFSPRTIAHEAGHACNLFGHSCADTDQKNMMATRGGCSPIGTVEGDRINPQISNIQALLIRASRHVTYF
jgi:hypothetical protein